MLRANYKQLVLRQIHHVCRLARVFPADILHSLCSIGKLHVLRLLSLDLID